MKQFVVKTITRKRAGAAQTAGPVIDTAMAGQHKTKTARDAEVKTVETSITTDAEKQTITTSTTTIEPAVQQPPARGSPAPPHAPQSTTLQSDQRTTSKAISRRQPLTQSFEGVQRTIKDIISKNRPDTPMENGRETAIHQPLWQTSTQHDDNRHTREAQGWHQAPNTDRPRESASRPKQSAWPPKAKIPKEPPKKSKKKAEAVPEQSSSSGGWDRGDVHFRSGHLGDWSGGLGPPILDWDYRPPFRAGQNEDYIEEWLDVVLHQLRNTELEIRMADYQRYIRMPESAREHARFDERWTRTIVPSYWMPVEIGNQSPALFWSSLKASMPEPYDENDLDGVQPWWDEFPPYQGAFQQVYEAPTVTDIDPDETRQQREARARDKGSQEATRNFLDKRQEKSSTRHKYPRHDTVVQSIKEQDPRIFKPSIKLLIRPAVRSDMMQIADIYNRYIHFAVCAPEEQEFTEEDMKARWRDCQAQSLPMLVACEPSYTMRPSKRRPQDDCVFIPEKVIGFACARDSTDAHACQRTKIVEFFTAHQYYMKGVGTCLLDKMLQSLSASHKAITYCEADIPPLPEGPDGEEVVIKSILIHFLWDQNQPERPRWIAPWLYHKFGFNECAVLTGVATKLDKVLV